MRSTAVILGLSLTLGRSLHGQGSRPAPDFSELRRILVEGMAREQASAAAFAAVRDGEIVWEEALGWADSANGIRATPNSPFLLASLNKTFESTLAAVLSERHRIDLDKPVNDYLRTTSVSSPAYDARLVTLRQLLMHTAGLSTFDIGCDSGRPVSECHLPSGDDLIRDYGIAVRPPGGEFDYSNLGYFVASHAVSRALGRPLHDAVRDEVLRPLGMTHSSIGLDSAEAREVVAWGPGMRDPVTTTTGYESSRGYASAHDLALFGAFHLKAHRRDQRAILSDAAIDSMQNATVPADGGQRYGLGWWIQDDRFGFRTVLAQGGNYGAQAWLRLVPSQRVAVVVLVNKGISFGESATDAALAAMLPKYAQGLAAKQAEVKQAAASGPAPTAAAPKPLDTAMTGRWVGAVHAVGGKVPVEFVIDSSGMVRAQIGARSDSGTARFGRQLVIRVPGDLEAANPVGMQRQIAIYLRPYKGGWGGVATVRPPSATGLDGRVSYFVEIGRR